MALPDCQRLDVTVATSEIALRKPYQRQHFQESAGPRNDFSVSDRMPRRGLLAVDGSILQICDLAVGGDTALGFDMQLLRESVFHATTKNTMSAIKSETICRFGGKFQLHLFEFTDTQQWGSFIIRFISNSERIFLQEYTVRAYWELRL